MKKLLFFVIIITFVSCSEKNAETVDKRVAIQQLLIEVGLGKVTPDQVSLSQPEEKIIDSLISINPSEFNVNQRLLCNMNSKYYPLDQLLLKVGMGVKNPDSVDLNAGQRKIVDSIISIAPDNYNAAQRKLGSK
jgi:hypothetical protein